MLRLNRKHSPTNVQVGTPRRSVVKARRWLRAAQRQVAGLKDSAAHWMVAFATIGLIFATERLVSATASLEKHASEDAKSTIEQMVVESDRSMSSQWEATFDQETRFKLLMIRRQLDSAKGSDTIPPLSNISLSRKELEEVNFGFRNAKNADFNVSGEEKRPAFLWLNTILASDSLSSNPRALLSCPEMCELILCDNPDAVQILHQNGSTSDAMNWRNYGITDRQAIESAVSYRTTLVRALNTYESAATLYLRGELPRRADEDNKSVQESDLKRSEIRQIFEDRYLGTTLLAVRAFDAYLEIYARIHHYDADGAPAGYTYLFRLAADTPTAGLTYLADDYNLNGWDGATGRRLQVRHLPFPIQELIARYR